MLSKSRRKVCQEVRGDYVSEKPSKSDQIRHLHDQGMSVAEIAKELNTYYSFVYRVLARYIKRCPTQRNGKNITTEVRNLWKKGKSVDEIMKTLEAPESRRSYIYSMVQRFKKEGNNGKDIGTKNNL